MSENKGVYFKSLELENVFCFKTKQTVSFMQYNKKDSPAMFTVILGNNNTGKTTLLRILGGWEMARPVTTKIKSNDIICLKRINYDHKETIIISLLYSVENIVFYIKTKNRFRCSLRDYPNLAEFINAYGVNRKVSKESFSQYKLEKIEDFTETLFNPDAKLLNAEDWLVSLVATGTIDPKQKVRLERVKEIIARVFASAEGNAAQEGRLEFEIDKAGKFQTVFITALGDRVPLRELGSGYQSIITLVVDLAYRMFTRYPDSEKPLEEPGVVLIDELDLHLHPEWQLRVVGFLRELFPKTQFIATAHSPLVVQSAKDLNIIVLRQDKENNTVKIEDANDVFGTDTFEGWTSEKILYDLMLSDSGKQLVNKEYKRLLEAFSEALNDEDLDLAKGIIETLRSMVPADSTLIEELEIEFETNARFINKKKKK